MKRRDCFVVMILAAMAGCGGGGVSGPAFAPVNGVITLDGKPVEGATIVFSPKKDGTMSMALSDPEGKFVMKSGSGRKGAAVGDHDVTVMLSVSIETEEKTTEDGLAPAMANELGTEVSKPKPAKVGFIIPARYNKPGALSATVPAGGLVNYKLELKT